MLTFDDGYQSVYNLAYPLLKRENFRATILLPSFPHAVFCEIEALAKEHGLANAQVVRELFFRGLAAYRDDGQLSVVQAPTHLLDSANQSTAVGTPNDTA